MSYEKDRYWQPPGLSAIQLQMNIALTRRGLGDESGVYDALKDLAVLTESQEIIELAEKFEKETDRDIGKIRNKTPLVAADRFTIHNQELAYLKGRNYEFLKLIIMESSKRGITIKMSNLVNGKQFGELEETEAKAETEEQQE